MEGGKRGRGLGEGGKSVVVVGIREEIYGEEGGGRTGGDTCKHLDWNETIWNS